MSKTLALLALLLAFIALSTGEAEVRPPRATDGVLVDSTEFVQLQPNVNRRLVSLRSGRRFATPGSLGFVDEADAVTWGKAKKWSKKAAKATKDAAERAAREAARKIKEAAREAKEAAEKAINGAKKLVDEIKKDVDKINPLKKMQAEAKNVGKQVGNFFDKASDFVVASAGMVQPFGQFAADFAKKIGGATTCKSSDKITVDVIPKGVHFKNVNLKFGVVKTKAPLRPEIDFEGIQMCNFGNSMKKGADESWKKFQNNLKAAARNAINAVSKKRFLELGEDLHFIDESFLELETWELPDSFLESEAENNLRATGNRKRRRNRKRNRKRNTSKGSSKGSFSCSGNYAIWQRIGLHIGATSNVAVGGGVDGSLGIAFGCDGGTTPFIVPTFDIGVGLSLGGPPGPSVGLHRSIHVFPEDHSKMFGWGLGIGASFGDIALEAALTMPSLTIKTKELGGQKIPLEPHLGGFKFGGIGLTVSVDDPNDMFADWVKLFASETKEAGMKAITQGATLDLGLGYVGRLSNNLLGSGKVNNYDNNMFGIGANSGKFMGCWFPELAWTVLPEWPDIKKQTGCK